MGRKNEGISEEQLRDMAQFETSGRFTETEKNVLRFATALSRTPTDVSDELFRTLQRDFSERQMVELSAAIAWENLRARLNRSFGIEAEGFSKGAYCPLPERRENPATESPVHGNAE